VTRSRVCRGFTLIELLLVFALIALIAGMVMTGMGAQRPGVHVRPAAEELAGVLRRARSLATSTMRPHAVVFNLANAGGSSGRILNNLDGGHWYRILGPVQGSDADSVPVLSTTFWNEYPNYGDFLEAVEGNWLGEAHVLPAGKVRFLALTDTDEGGRFANKMTEDLVQTAPALSESFYASSGESPNTYPRPWFGWYDQASKRLHAWGGYDPSNASTRAFAGFCFQGGAAAITDSKNPSDKTITWYPSRASRQFFDPKNGALSTGASQQTRTILKTGEVRPVVNAAWRDAAIVFLPDGRAQMLPWNEARARYYDCDPVLVGSWVDHNKEICPNWTGSGHQGWTWSTTSGNGTSAGGLATHQGVAQVDPGTARPCPGPPAGSILSSMSNATMIGGTWSKIRNIAREVDRVEETASFDSHTGGWFFTLGPDVSRERTTSGADDNRFSSADEALRSMLPAVRVFVSKAGLISIVPVRRRDDLLNGTTTWPPVGWTTGYWNDIDTTFNQNDLAMNLRWGWLHSKVGQFQNSNAFVPRGVPIVRSVGLSMLTQRIWWVDPPGGATWNEP
jgi:prepilin-type N-terminal cleavage/methylation domain-containing protein